MLLFSSLLTKRFAGHARESCRPGPWRKGHACSIAQVRKVSPILCKAAQPQASMEISGDYCLPAYVTFDNEVNPNFTVLEVEVHDYPGLVRVLAWVLNGLDLIAQNAILSTDSNGTARNTFWVSTIRGKKLSTAKAELLADRVKDFVTYCSPKPGMEAATEFTVGPVTVSNSEHDAYTVVYVRECNPHPGFLLEVASVMSGLNAQIHQGIIQGCTDCGDDVPQLESNDMADQEGRLFKFWVQDRLGSKLDYNHISALIYALGVGLGFQSFQLSPPNQEVLQSHWQ